MSQDSPDLIEILNTVDEYLESLSDRLEPGDRYQVLCIKHLLRIVQRELINGERIDQQERAALQAFDQDLDSASLPDAYTELAGQIRAGQYDEKWTDLFELLLEHVEHKVTISDPDYIK